VNRVDNPVDAGIATDGLVLRIDEDDFVVLVGRVLVHPVRVENTQIRTTAADTLLCGGAEGALVLKLIDTLVRGFTYSRRQSSNPNVFIVTGSKVAQNAPYVAPLGAGRLRPPRRTRMR
jgi:hypothetical protein